MPRWVPKSTTVRGVPVNEKEFKEFFKRFDADGDGRLNEQELTNAFKSLGSRFPAWRVKRGLHHADSNGDGCISNDELDDLVKYVSRLGYRIC